MIEAILWNARFLGMAFFWRLKKVCLKGLAVIFGAEESRSVL